MERGTPRFGAIVLARSGSKAIPHKNLKTLGGETLVSRAVKAGHDLGATEVFVSTDYPSRSLCISSQYVHVERPRYLRGDEVSSWAVVDALVSQVEDINWFVLLQPTSPLRPVAQGERFLRMASWTSGSLSLEVCPVGRSESKNGILLGGQFKPFMKDTVRSSNRQHVPFAYAITGRYYLFDRNTLRRLKSGEEMYLDAIVTPCVTTADVDHIDDLIGVRGTFERLMTQLGEISGAHNVSTR